MLLTVEEIQKHGGFTGGPVKRLVTWKDKGEEHSAEIWVRAMSYHTAVTDLSTLGESRQMVVARRLSACLCDEEGVPLFTVTDITGIDQEGKPIMVKDPKNGEMVERGAFCTGLTNALLEIIGEVSGLGKKKPKENSNLRTSSGTSSSSTESGEKPSKKQKET